MDTIHLFSSFHLESTTISNPPSSPSYSNHIRTVTLFYPKYESIQWKSK